MSTEVAKGYVRAVCPECRHVASLEALLREPQVDTTIVFAQCPRCEIGSGASEWRAAPVARAFMREENGMAMLCARCADLAQAEHEALEAGFAAHQLSHGVCPECARTKMGLDPALFFAGETRESFHGARGEKGAGA